MGSGIQDANSSCNTRNFSRSARFRAYGYRECCLDAARLSRFALSAEDSRKREKVEGRIKAADAATFDVRGSMFDLKHKRKDLKRSHEFSGIDAC
jgi:hypothetical protein